MTELKIELCGEGLTRFREEIESRVVDQAFLDYQTPGAIPSLLRNEYGMDLASKSVLLKRDSKSGRVAWAEIPSGEGVHDILTTPEISEEVCHDFLIMAFAFASLIERENLKVLPALVNGVVDGNVTDLNYPGCLVRMLQLVQGGRRFHLWKAIVDSAGTTGYWSPSFEVARAFTSVPEPEYSRAGHFADDPDARDEAMRILLNAETILASANGQAEREKAVKSILESLGKIKRYSEGKGNPARVRVPKIPFFSNRVGNA